MVAAIGPLTLFQSTFGSSNLGKSLAHATRSSFFAVVPKQDQRLIHIATGRLGAVTDGLFTSLMRHAMSVVVHGLAPAPFSALATCPVM